MHPKQLFDLSQLDWSLTGFMPTSWKGKSMELGFPLEPEFAAVPARVPGSVQSALRAANMLPDWYLGLNSRACEWVENREWMFTAKLPDTWIPVAPGQQVVLRCGGLDGNGIVVFNKKQVGTFDNAFVPYAFDLTEHVRETDNTLHIIFFVPPRWLGQVGYTSEMKDWKPRFNYSWDWIPRLVQLGPWEPVTLEVVAPATASFAEVRTRTEWDVASRRGALHVQGSLDADSARVASTDQRVRVTLRHGASILRVAEMGIADFAAGQTWSDLAVEPWWPNGAGDRPLYTVDYDLLAGDAATAVVVDRQTRTVGFKHIAWEPCTNAPEGADPWICVVNGTPIFLQGVDWTPIRPNFADLTRADYAGLIDTYKALGANIFRVWGGAFLEKDWFYELCDTHGFLVWQEFPLSSSGHENWPHEDEPSMRVLVDTARSYIVRKQHHASLLMWCGGNELQGGMDGGKVGVGLPVGMDHPLMQRWGALVTAEDPGRRFVPTSSSGPRFMAFPKDFGKGLHWDVHGPWKGPGATVAEWQEYWDNDDSLFRSETGAPGTSSAELIRQYAGGLPTTPGTMENPLWRRFSWWLEWADFIKEQGHEPASLDEYVAWSQARQALALSMAARACKSRFPGIGGIILWMGHDAFPCIANTSIIDFHGVPKPAGLAVGEVWNTPAEQLRRV